AKAFVRHVVPGTFREEGQARRAERGGATQTADDRAGANKRDAVVDLDVVVVQAQVQPVCRIPHRTEGVLLGGFRTQVRVCDTPGVDLRVTNRVAGQHDAGGFVVGGVSTER